MSSSSSPRPPTPPDSTDPSPSSSPPRNYPHQAPITSSNAFKPPSSGSSSSHPLLAPVYPTASAVLAAEVDPFGAELQHRRATPTVAPEKCLTFCSQRADAPPLCRMFCLRRRQPQPSRSEQLARLRPQRRSTVEEGSTASSSSSSGSSSGSIESGGLRWSPFGALAQRVEPYSIVYVRGTPDGVIGRYMEEMEYDDGQYDFGGISRGTEHLTKRKREEPRMEWLDWGEHGALLHLPLTSLFRPITSIPSTLSRVFSPPLALLSRYRQSFEDGTQTRALEKFSADIKSGGAASMLGKVRGHWEKRVKEREEELQKERMGKMGKGVEGKDGQ